VIGEDFVVSLDAELNNLVFHQDEKLFENWWPESVIRIMGADSIIPAMGSFHKHVKNLVLRIFGPENLRLVILQDVQRTAHASLLSWLDLPSVELKEAVSSVCLSR
jgi:cytochrome P450 family 26 subfamily A